MADRQVTEADRCREKDLRNSGYSSERHNLWRDSHIASDLIVSVCLPQYGRCEGKLQLAACSGSDAAAVLCDRNCHIACRHAAEVQICVTAIRDMDGTSADCSHEDPTEIHRVCVEAQ